MSRHYSAVARRKSRRSQSSGMFSIGCAWPASRTKRRRINSAARWRTPARPALWRIFEAKLRAGSLFKKSGAKILFMLGHGLCRRQRPWPSITKFFATFCSQKVAFLPTLKKPPAAEPGFPHAQGRPGWRRCPGSWCCRSTPRAAAAPPGRVSALRLRRSCAAPHRRRRRRNRVAASTGARRESIARASGVSSASALGSKGRGTLRARKAAEAVRSTKVLARSFRPGIRVRMRVCAVASALMPMRRQPRQHVAGQPRVIGAAQPQAVQMRQLGIIHPARRAAHAFQGEQGNLLLARQKLGIAMAPAEAEQIIAQRLGQKTLVRGIPAR